MFLFYLVIGALQMFFDDDDDDVQYDDDGERRVNNYADRSMTTVGR